MTELEANVVAAMIERTAVGHYRRGLGGAFALRDWDEVARILRERAIPGEGDKHEQEGKRP